MLPEVPTLRGSCIGCPYVSSATEACPIALYPGLCAATRTCLDPRDYPPPEKTPTVPEKP